MRKRRKANSMELNLVEGDDLDNNDKNNAEGEGDSDSNVAHTKACNMKWSFTKDH